MSSEHNEFRDDDEEKHCEGKFDEGKHDGAWIRRVNIQEGKEDIQGKVSTEQSADDNDLISKVQEFFFANDSLAKTFEDFVKEKAHIIDLASTEYKLGYTQVYDEFKVLFESSLERFIVNDMGCSIQRFYHILKSRTEENEDSNEAIFGQILLAVCDFDVFMTMMKEEALASSRK